MSVASTIKKQIDFFEPGVIFSYHDFNVLPKSMEATAAILSRLVSKGAIKRFEKGKFFKPEHGMLGEIPLKENEILKPILKEKGNLIGYLTGTNTYNQMGLTTQISNEYIIATSELRKPTRKGHMNVRFVKAYSLITKSNIPLLQLLDAIKDVKNIAGKVPNEAIEFIFIMLKELSLTRQKEIAELALNYPPSTRALIGAMLELLGNISGSKKLYKSLNLLSKYNLGIKENLLTNRYKWKIISNSHSTIVPLKSKKGLAHVSIKSVTGLAKNVTEAATQIPETKKADFFQHFDSQLKELKQLIDIHINECSTTYTPTVCLMIDTAEGRAKVHDRILILCLEKCISVGQAVNEIEKDFNLNLRND